MSDPRASLIPEAEKHGGGPPPVYGQQGYPQGSQPQTGYPHQGEPGYQPPAQPNYQSMGQSGYPQVVPTVVYQTQPDPTAAQVPNIVGAYITSCLVFWCCNPLFGAIGFFIALTASCALGSRDMTKANALWKASMIVSIFGIIITVILVAVVVGICESGDVHCNNKNGTHHR